MLTDPSFDPFLSSLVACARNDGCTTAILDHTPTQGQQSSNARCDLTLYPKRDQQEDGRLQQHVTARTSEP